MVPGFLVSMHATRVHVARVELDVHTNTVHKVRSYVITVNLAFLVFKFQFYHY